MTGFPYKTCRFLTFPAMKLIKKWPGIAETLMIPCLFSIRRSPKKDQNINFWQNRPPRRSQNHCETQYIWGSWPGLDSFYGAETLKSLGKINDFIDFSYKKWSRRPIPENELIFFKKINSLQDSFQIKSIKKFLALPPTQVMRTAAAVA